MAPPKTGHRRFGSCPGKEGESSPYRQGAAANDADPAFDQWLQEKLQVLYGPVVDEPIPEDWLKIIQELGSEKKQ